jgi:DNA-directed DNA polymerase III PolC
MSGFVHLHVHSTFSFMDGAATLDGLIERAKQLGMDACGLTDHQGLYGALRFYAKARAAGLRPIIGAEVAVEPSGIFGQEADVPPDARLPAPLPVGSARARASGFHLTLLVRNMAGYRNLCMLLSRAHLRAGDAGDDLGGARSVVTLADLARLSEGLIGLSGCANGEVGASVLVGVRSRARDAARRLAGCFAPGDFYVEMVHAMTPESPRYVAALADLAASLDLPVVATNDVHYLRRADAPLHDVLAAVGARSALPNPYARTNSELFLKSAADMRRLFSGHPSACDATLEIAARCDLDLGLGQFHFPSVEVPRGETPYSVLSKLAWRGLEKRYRPVTPESVRRLQHELAVIEQLGFPEYFLVVKDIVDFARGRGIRYSGRGSAGDSIVSYVLNITDADPVAYSLLFERFLNPARRQMPDIDVDFDSARRDEVIDYIYARFGARHVAMVATVNTMTAKSAVRCAAKALGHNAETVNALSRHLPWVSARKIREVLATYPECRSHPLRDEARHGMLLDLTERLDRFPTHLGTHLGGFLITKEPVDTWTPLQWAAKGTVVSQYDKDDIEALGLVKMDILGLRMHSAISQTVELARARVGETAVPEPFLLPHDDPKVYANIAAADTVGMFQLESSGQRNLAMRLQERDFEDIIAAISLFRPGPLEAEMIVPFIRRRHGLEKVVVPHPAMGAVLADSYGVIVYQEQVLQVAQAVAGFTLAEADSFRRAMTKDRSRAEMESLHGEFVRRACALGSSEAVAEEVFRQLQGFAAYGFNKAHAACFAVVSYASAWLKTYFPAEFAASIVNNEPMGFYSPRLVLDDARHHGIALLHPHVNASEADCTVECDGRAIRVGLKGLHDMNARLLRAIRDERRVRPFDDLTDFLRRTRAEADAASSLIRVGALDSLGATDAGRPPTRDEQLALLPELKAVLAREGGAGERALLLAPSRARDATDLTHPSGWDVARRLGAELELTGLAITCHPLELARDDLETRGVIWAADLPRCEDRARVKVAGVRERAQTPRTRSGKRVCFLTLEDPTGLLDVVVFPEALQRSGEAIVKHRCYIVEGVLQNNVERGITVVADIVRPYAVRTATGAAVRLRRGVGTAAMGPFRGGAGHTDEEEWEMAEATVV